MKLPSYPGADKPQKWEREQAARERRLRGEPEPFGEEFQEQFLQTVVLDSEFALAVRTALDAAGGDQ